MQALQKLRRMPVGLTAPAFAILVVAFGIPMVLLFLKSLNAPAISLAYYQGFFAEQSNVRVLFQTVEVSIVATVLCLIIGYPTAYLIVAASKGLRTALIVLVLIPYLTSGLARTYAWVVILGDRGIINNLLLDYGVISIPLQLIYNRMAIYIGMVHIMLPMMILPLVSVMHGIDKSLMAAARSMGAPPFVAFWRVFFPLTLPGVRSGALLVFVICLGFYITPQALGGLRDAMLSTFIKAQVDSALNLGSIAASSFILLGVAAVMLSVFGLDISGKQGLVQQVRKSTLSRLMGALMRYLNELTTPYRSKRWIANLYSPRGDSRWWKAVGTVFLMFVMSYLLFPSFVIIIMSFGAGTTLEFPPRALSLQWYRSFFDNPWWTSATWNSIEIGIAVTIISTIVGTLAAYGLSRTSPRLRGFLTMLILTPITFPVIVVGIATYLGLVNLGLIGSKIGLALAHTIGSITFVVVIVAANLANFDTRLEQAAKSMRAGPVQTFMRVTLPLIRPGIIGGAVFAFIHSFDEVVISSLVGGSVRTLPLKMWDNMRNEMDPTIAAVASLLTLLPVLWLVALYFMSCRPRPGAHRAFQVSAS